MVGVTSANIRPEPAVNFKAADVSGTSSNRSLENIGSLLSVGEIASLLNIVGLTVESGTINKACVLSSGSLLGGGGKVLVCCSSKVLENVCELVIKVLITGRMVGGPNDVETLAASPELVEWVISGANCSDDGMKKYTGRSEDSDGEASDERGEKSDGVKVEGRTDGTSL